MVSREDLVGLGIPDHQLHANHIALKTKTARFEDLVPVFKYVSGDITWLLVTLDGSNRIGGLVNWGRGFLPFDHVNLLDFLDGCGPMQGLIPEEVEFETQWPVSAYLEATASVGKW